MNNIKAVCNFDFGNSVTKNLKSFFQKIKLQIEISYKSKKMESL